MKLRRSLAKLIAMIMIIEVILNPIGQNSNLVFAATDETIGTTESFTADSTEAILGEEVEATQGITESEVSQESQENIQESQESIEEGSDEAAEDSKESADETVEDGQESSGEAVEDSKESAEKEAVEDEQESTEEGSEGSGRDNTENSQEGLGNSQEGSVESTEALEEGEQDNQESTENSQEGSVERTETSDETLDEEIIEETIEGIQKPIQLLASSLELGNSNIPTTKAALESSGITTFSISNYQGWLNLQALSKETSLEGYTFKILIRTENSGNLEYYDFTALNSLNDIKFEGIGTEATPFKGTLYTDYTTGVTLRTDVALFNYLSTKANLQDLLVEPQGACAGLAANLKVESETFTGFDNIIVSASEEGISGDVAGGLFANVVNETGTAFLLKATGVIVNATVKGGIAGGLIGSMTGAVTLYMDGGIQWAPSVEASDLSSTIGGWIGSIDAQNQKITIQGSESGIVYNFQGIRASVAGTTGGLFGKIANAEIELESKLEFNKSSESGYDLAGTNTGVFAGLIENAQVHFYQSVRIAYVRLRIGQPTGDQKDGVGGFVGMIKNSVVDSVTSEGKIRITGLYIQNDLGYTTKHNIGGFAGYAQNTYFLFSQGECVVNNLTARKTYGNVAGAIGLFEADSTMGGTVIQNIAVTGTTSVYAMNGNAAGIIAKMVLADCDVKVEKCYGENLIYAGNNVSLGIGGVFANKTPAKLRLSSVLLNGTYDRGSGYSYNPVIGGMIGYIDCDLEIAGNITDAGQFDTGVSYLFVNSGQWSACIGGLIGAVCQSGTKYREVDISNVIVGTPNHQWQGQANIYGGLIGRVEDRTSVCLDQKIYTNGGTAVNWKGTALSVSRQYSDPGFTYFGSVVGSQNYSLIYLQPTADLQITTSYNLDEVGNYGGIFRNGNWDEGTTDAAGNWIPADNNEDPSTWLIQDHTVMGEWDLISYDSSKNVYGLKIDTIGDIMRLAIFGNTNNRTGGTSTEYQWGDGFFPFKINQYGSVTEMARNDVFYGVMMADFYLEPGIYNLTGTGIDSLYRNDQVGVNGGYDNENVWRASVSKVKNSFICEDGIATIQYELKSHAHQYIGLFPYINGDQGSGNYKTIEYKNLNLVYNIAIDGLLYTGNELGQASASQVNYNQYVGGLSAMAANNVEITNVTYQGLIDDNIRYNMSTRYSGGLIGFYEGASGKSISLSEVNGNVDISFRHAKTTVSGVLGHVHVPASGKTYVNMDNLQLQGSIVAEQTDTTEAVKTGGILSRIYSTGANGHYVDLNLSNISIGDFSIHANDTSLAYPSIGGALGYSWNDCNVTLTNISVGETGAFSISANANFGGLVHDVRGTMTISDVTFGANSSFDTHGAGEDCGLIVRDGRYLYLDVKDYTVAEGVTLKNYTGEWFDELVGFNKGGDNAECGGIVTLRNGAGNSLGKADAAYYSYGYGYHVVDETGAYVKKTNSNTRYYYDLHQLDYSVDFQTMDSPEDVMVWHLMHYANDYIINYCMENNGIAPIYTATSIPTSYTISGFIDMAGYSIYPTSVTYGESYNGTNGTICYDAKGIYDGENTLRAANAEFVEKQPKEAENQHYLMHAGLFYHVWTGLDVTGLTLTGTYSMCEYGVYSYMAGALVCGGIYGMPEAYDSQGKPIYLDVERQFNNIHLSDLWCVGESGKLSESDNYLDAYLGLMIGGIAQGAKVSFDGIYMENYTDADGAAGYKAASALIGMVGSAEATDISLAFKNLDIMDAAAGKSSASLNSSAKEEVLARASLIYYYNYKENCSGIYTFNSEDYLVGKLGADRLDTYEDDGVVTLGQELGNQLYGDKNYAQILYYNNEDPVGMASKREDAAGNEITVAVTEIPFDCNNYLPYVYVQEQNILVNPKVESIIDGCGTYEDPYIISTAVQLITIYRYLYEEELYKEVLGMMDNEWKMHAFGSDSYLCDETTSSTTGHGVLIPYEKERSEDSKFPTKEELSQAYYMITGDIDLSKYPEFIGFGREEMPFIGVFVGESGDSVPAITMLEQSDSSTISQYAFIQMAKGVVVKDLTFVFNSSINIDSEAGGIGAAVIASVLGGDNIIDGVTIKAAGDNACFTVKRDNAVVGGYVGLVELGGVVFRNIGESNISGFSIATQDAEDYPYIGSLAGRVLDGYVVYDGDSDSSAPLYKNTANGAALSVNGLPMAGTYDVLNGAYLDSAASKIVWTGNGFQIADNKQLQIISMALNSGMFNYNTAKGYGSDSRQRNGDYDYIKNTSGGQFTAAYYDVIAGDNKSVFADSYLWRYFEDASGDLLSAAQNGGLNPTPVSSANILTYELTGTTYDMSGFKTAFRGLGARYHGTEYGSNNGSNSYIMDAALLFKSNLVGSDAANPAHITLDMMVTREMDSRRAGLLNEIPNTSAELLIQNITLSGNVKNDGLSVEEKNAGGDYAYFEPLVSYSAGGFASDNLSHIRFENIRLADLTVEATGYAGGLIGHVKEYTTANTWVNDTQLENLTVIGGCDEESAGITNGHAGGIIGKFESNGNGSKLYIGTEDGTDKDSLQGVTANQITIYTRGKNSAAGGLVGMVYSIYQNANNTYIYNCDLINADIYTKNAYQYSPNGATAGGIIGVGHQAALYLYNNTIGSADGSGTVSIALKGENIASDSDTVMEYNVLSGAGGLIGRHYGNGSAYAAIENCQVLGVLSDYGTSTTTIEGYGMVGGLLGVADQAMISNSLVKELDLKGIYQIGGAVGLVKTEYNSFTMENVEVAGCHLDVENTINGALPPAWNNPGEIGGLVGAFEAYGWNYTVVFDSCKATENIIAPTHTRIAGGFLGKSNQRITISGESLVENNVICGDIVGGVIGSYEPGGASTSLNMSGITITGNRIVSCVIESVNGATRSNLAGGFAGKIDTAQSMGAFDGIEITNNLISASNSSNGAYIGGVVGVSNANTYFYETKLKDNFIGIFENASMAQKAADSWNILHPGDLLTDTTVILQYFMKNEDIANMKEYLCTKTAVSADDSELISINTLSNLQEEDFYKYSYGMGAVAGKVYGSVDRKNTFVGLNIQYTDNTYRPASDVGMTEEVASSQEMYETYRKEYYIVYDSMNAEKEWTEEEYSGFVNLELIYDDYLDEENVDRCYAYDLGSNYLAGAFSDISLSTIYEETYYKNGAYISDFVDETGKVVPMVIFRTTDNGSLDEIIQSHINMLTNNSGGVNTYTHQTIEVTTSRKLLVKGVLKDDTNAEPAVQVKQNGNQYEFVNELDGERLYDKMTSAETTSFTLITISYLYDGVAKWSLEIPVYVEQELEFESHMRFVKGIEYNVNTVKAGFSCDVDSEMSTGLDSGESYSLYLEYIYGEARTRYPNATIPKQLYMKTNNEVVKVSFLPGTQMTLVDLETGKPYYYIVDSTDGDKIDFTKFKDSDSNAYVVKNINSCSEYVGEETFTTVCNEEKNNVAVESYLLLVDTSNVEKEVKNRRGNALYGLYTDISKLQETDARLYNRIDYTEHCIVRITETMGMSAEFTDNYTLEGEISEDGNVSLTLEYNVSVSGVWQSANEGTPVYLDLAVGLEKNNNGSIQQISLPAGTQVYFEKQTTNSNGDLIFERYEAVYVIHGSGISDVYYYANSNQEMDVLKLPADIDNTNTVRIVLDFSQADMSSFENTAEGESYGIVADLLVGKDKSNPGSGETYDTFRGSVVVNIISELGFALQPDDLISLGINRYQPSETDGGILPYKAKIAFPEDYVSEDVQGKYYGIVYKVEEKTQKQHGVETPVYAPLNSSGITIYRVKDGAESGLVNYNKTDCKYYYSSLTYEDLTVSGNVAEASFVLKVGENMDFSNYRVTGYLIISDTQISNPVDEVISNGELNQDFFVYTLAKVKTDLD